MSSRWLQLGTLSLLIAPGTWVFAQAPKADRDGGLLPPVVQVMAKEPIEEEEITVELIKSMPKVREQVKKAEDSNFKVIKVKRDKTDEPISITSSEPPKVVEKAEKPDKVVVARRDEPLNFVPIEKQQAMPTLQAPPQTTPVAPSAPAKLLEERPTRLVKVPVRENAYGDYSLPELKWPDWSSGKAGTLEVGEDFKIPGIGESNVGWIDPALIGNQVRFRYDAQWHNPTPDRAEFITARNKQYFDGTNISGRGFEVPESNIDMFEGISYVEWAFTPRISAFMEMPIRYIRPNENPTAFGGGDFNIGFKFAYFALPEQVQTFQLRLIFPTGDDGKGLGTGHTVIEPSLLLWQKLSEKFTLEAELRNWIPVGGLNYSGYTLRYGLGLSYDLYQSETISVKPVTELIGWSTLRGMQSDFIDTLPTSIVTSSAQSTVIESAWGLRGTVCGNCDYYTGFSYALTSTTWFQYNLRAELRWRY